jgi:hypothetical protein
LRAEFGAICLRVDIRLTCGRLEGIERLFRQELSV